MTYEFSLTIFIIYTYSSFSWTEFQIQLSTPLVFQILSPQKMDVHVQQIPTYILITHVYPTHIKRSTTKPGILPQLTNEVSLDTSVSSPLKTMMTSSRALAEQASGHGFDDEFPGISSLVGSQKTGGNNNAQMLFLPPKWATTTKPVESSFFFLFVFSFRV